MPYWKLVHDFIEPLTGIEPFGVANATLQGPLNTGERGPGFGKPRRGN